MNVSSASSGETAEASGVLWTSKGLRARYIVRFGLICRSAPPIQLKTIAWVYRVVAISKGRVKEIIRQYDTYEQAFKKLHMMNQRYYINDVQHSFSIVVERA
jgi:hypothetical protein|tara:strand:+ start:540 stop:845 length:306 start_codon:yes stop_codon:yes gene_type:complete